MREPTNAETERLALCQIKMMTAAKDYATAWGRFQSGSYSVAESGLDTQGTVLVATVCEWGGTAQEIYGELNLSVLLQDKQGWTAGIMLTGYAYLVALNTSAQNAAEWCLKLVARNPWNYQWTS